VFEPNDIEIVQFRLAKIAHFLEHEFEDGF